MDRWMDGCINVSMEQWMNVFIDVWMDGWIMDEWMDERMCGIDHGRMYR